MYSHILREVDGLLSRYAEVEVGSVFHLICVARLFDPVTNRMAVYPVHHVTVVIHTVPVMMWPIAYRHTHLNNYQSFTQSSQSFTHGSMTN